MNVLIVIGFISVILIIGAYLEPYRQKMLKGIDDRHNTWLEKSRKEIVDEFGEEAGIDFDNRFKPKIRGVLK